MVFSHLPDELYELFEAEEEVMSAKFSRGKIQHNHGTIRGDISERVLREFLEKYLPSTYRFANGEITDRHGTYSGEVDIAICSPAHPFTFSKEGIGLLFVEGVEAVVESKSTLKTGTLKDALRNCWSIRQLEAGPVGGTSVMRMSENHSPMERIKLTPHAIFAYSSDLTLKTIIENMKKIKNNNNFSEEEMTDIVCVLDRGTIVRDRSIDNLLIEKGSEGYHIVNSSPSLLSFLMFLQDKMPTPLVSRNPLSGYMKQ